MGDCFRLVKTVRSLQLSLLVDLVGQTYSHLRRSAAAEPARPIQRAPHRSVIYSGQAAKRSSEIYLDRPRQRVLALLIFRGGSSLLESELGRTRSYRRHAGESKKKP